jgi:hypothetical protein
MVYTTLFFILLAASRDIMKSQAQMLAVTRIHNMARR